MSHARGGRRSQAVLRALGRAKTRVASRTGYTSARIDLRFVQLRSRCDFVGLQGRAQRPQASNAPPGRPNTARLLWWWPYRLSVAQHLSQFQRVRQARTQPIPSSFHIERCRGLLHYRCERCTRGGRSSHAISSQRRESSFMLQTSGSRPGVLSRLRSCLEQTECASDAQGRRHLPL